MKSLILFASAIALAFLIGCSTTTSASRTAPGAVGGSQCCGTNCTACCGDNCAACCGDNCAACCGDACVTCCKDKCNDCCGGKCEAANSTRS